MQFSSTQLQSAVNNFVSVHPSLLSGSDASTRLAETVRFRNQLAAYEAALAARAVEAGVPQTEGARDPNSWVANKTGTSVGAAKSKLDTAAALGAQPDVADAFSSGDISAEQASLISSAAASSPSSARPLVEAAKNGASMNQLKKSCRNASSRSNSAEDEISRWARMRAKRSFRTWTDKDGMLRGEFCLMPDDGSVLSSRLKPFIKAAYKDAKARKGLIVQDRMAADGFVAFIESCGPERKTRRVDVVISVDYEALLRGYVQEGETCEILGLGPVPVALVEVLRKDAYISVIVRKGMKPLFEASETQEITNAQRVAVMHRDECCQVPGCESTFQLEVDHIHERRHGGRHRIENLMVLCKRHHDQKTFRGFRMVGDGPTRIWVGPQQKTYSKAA